MVNKKIAFIGNMNNNFSAFAKYIREKKIEVHLFLLDNDYFHPKDDSFSDEWKLYTFRLNWGSLDSWSKIDFKKIKKQFNKYDLTIGCDAVPAFFNKAGLDLDIFIPYGFDLYSMPYFKMVHPKRILAKFLTFKYQKKGIKYAKNIFIAPTGGILEKNLNEIKPTGKIYRGGVPMIYYPDFHTNSFESEKQKSKITKTLVSLKKQGKTIIFHSSRHYWKTKKSVNSIKGNDILFKGLKKTIDYFKSNKINLHIVTFEYGKDVNYSKELIKKLGIEEYVTWIPRSPRKEVMIGLSQSDIVVGELFHSYFSYGIIYEAMALKKLIVHKRIDLDYESYYKELYQMCYADSIDSIYLTFKNYVDNLIDHKEITENTFNWFQENLIEEPVNKLISILNKKNVNVT